MNILQTLILGFVEGITEFLPISSTAHLIITSEILGITQTEFLKLFHVVIQSGAILSVIFLYFNYLVKNKDVLLKLLASFLPTAVIGLLFFNIIKDVFFESFTIIAVALFTIGLLFIYVEKKIKKGKLKLNKNISDLSYFQAALVGFFQAFAIIPGVSRAGAVIVAMMILGFKRDESATYSFLLAVPTIGAASLFDLYKNFNLLSGNAANIQTLVIGFFVAFISAFFAVKWLISYLKKNSLEAFGYYRIALAIILLLFFI
ncbi:MAG: undecaprenyl-diphosphate phosphatase [Patescibacteria group bacterium]